MNQYIWISGLPKIALPVLFTLLSLSVKAGNYDSIRVRNFVIKSYITLTNTKPTRPELDSICGQNKLYEDFNAGSKTLIDSLLNSHAFAAAVYDIYRYEYLQGVTTEQINDDIDQFDQLLSIRSQSDFWDVFRGIRSRLVLLLAVEPDVSGGSISIPQALKRFFDNKYYDGLNMGSNNFVVSTFNYLLFRNPTKAELEEGKKFIDGNFGKLFFKTGKTKNEYLDALMSSGEFREGQVRYWYEKLLNREPQVSEMIGFLDCSVPLNIKLLIRQILLKKEFCRL